eukprot:TRINITY_DN14650_c0_g2_i5.p1 TRINITY_DN14650_c0_g2~~TRINITY_DN14650_c0_g2_i5.p1  ORF type:complete len:235 (-),score=36.23 TRINITY_DN14650_c0_g2_i5:229-897(-)
MDARSDMASCESALVQKPLKRSIGLSDAAEQRWREMNGGEHLLPTVAGLLEEHVQDNACKQRQPVLPLAQAMGPACGRRSMSEQRGNVVVAASSAHLPQEFIRMNRDDGQDTQTRSGIRVPAALQTQQLYEESSRAYDGPPLPPSLQRLVDAVLNGWRVRITQSQLDDLLTQVEASDSGEEEVDSQADTSVGPGSASDSEDDDGIDAEWSSPAVLGERRVAP